MDGALAAVVPDVLSGITEIFQITPTYYVAAYEGLVIGQVISQVGLIGKALQLTFPDGSSTAVVNLTQDGQTLKLSIDSVSKRRK